MEGALIRRVVKHAAQAVIGAACLLWLSWWFVAPEPQGDDAHLAKNAHSRFFRTDGREGSIFLFQTIPFTVVAILSFVVIELRASIRSKDSIPSNGKGGKGFRFSSIKTYPLWVRSPFGVLTGAEVLFIMGVLFVVLYNFGRYNYVSFKVIDSGKAHHHHGPIVSKSWQKVNYASYYFGTASILPFALLWIPVSRGSPFLRLIGLPFEHAVKYHIWLAVFMLFLLTLHSVGYIVFYMNTGQTALITGWITTGDERAVVAGLVAWIAGLIMWITSLSFFRRRWYEFFFGVHHLYIIFSLFWVYHVVFNYHFFVIPILLFLVDRFLRMFQSRQLVDVLSAKVLESGSVELKLAKNSNKGLIFHSLSTWCIQVPSLSKIQWHFFSATSTPTKDDKELSIVIKPLGAWTNKLRDQLKASMDTKQSPPRCPFSFKARVEGPYGDESDFYLEYQTLVLVGAGIGVTPLLAILRDVLHRHGTTQHKSPNLPTTLEVYHCVRKPQELCVLNEYDPNQILPDYDKLGLNIQIHAYVTSRLLDDYPKHLAAYASSHKSEALDLAKFGGSNQESAMRFVSPNIGVKPRGISSISAAGNTKWLACISISSMVGYFVLSGLANVYIVKAYEYEFPNYNRAHVVVLCMLLGIFVFGGAMLLVWLIHDKKTTDKPSLVQPKSTTPSSSPYQGNDFYDNEANAGYEGSPWNGDLNLYCRPNWKNEFNGLANRYKGQRVGVLVSGAQSIQEDVASECRRHSQFLLAVTPEKVAFEFHSVSFDL